MIGGSRLRQHVVEFKTTGYYLDGVLITSGAGPFSWTVPDGVADLTVNMCGGGQAGGAGASVASALSAGGGQGGTAGCFIFNRPVSAIPNSTLTITIGAGGVGSSTPINDAPNGGTTSISGLLPTLATNAGVLSARGGTGWKPLPTSSTSAVVTNGGGNSTAGADGDNGFAAPWSNAMYLNTITYIEGFEYASQGGGGKASGVAGGNGGIVFFNYDVFLRSGVGLNWLTQSSGTTSGGASFGGGGRGMPSFFSMNSLAGGNGDQVGEDAGATDYGAGGGGSGGSIVGRKGGNGGPGYLRFTYWSAD